MVSIFFCLNGAFNLMWWLLIVYMHFKNLHSLDWLKTLLQEFWPFQLYVQNILLLRNIKLKSLLLNNFFSNSKLKKNRRILLCCLEHRIWINYKIFDIILLLLASTITSLLLLATTTQVSFTRNYCVSS